MRCFVKKRKNSVQQDELLDEQEYDELVGEDELDD